MQRALVWNDANQLAQPHRRSVPKNGWRRRVVVKLHRDTVGTSIFFDTAFASVNIHLLRTKALRF
jgi:hypothetical protein